MERENVVHEVRLKLLYILLLPFASQKLLPRFEQVFYRNDIVVGMQENTSLTTPPPQEFVAHFGAYQTGLSVVA